MAGRGHSRHKKGTNNACLPVLGKGRREMERRHAEGLNGEQRRREEGDREYIEGMLLQ